MFRSYVGPYIILSRLGQGSLGEVLRGEDMRTGQQAALKLIEPQFAQHSVCKTKIEILQPKAQPTIAPLAYTINNQDGLTYLAMPYLADGSLYRYLQLLGKQSQLTMQQMLQIIDHILIALLALAPPHSNRQTHGGLHPRNVLLQWSESDEPDSLLQPVTFHLADFGQAALARELTANDTQPYHGWTPYTPPLDVLAQGEDERLDIFSLGHLLYWMATGTHLFEMDIGQYQLPQLPVPAGQQEAQEPTREGLIYLALTAVRIYTNAPEPGSLRERWQRVIRLYQAGALDLANIDPQPSESTIDPLWHHKMPQDKPDLPPLTMPLKLPQINVYQSGTGTPSEDQDDDDDKDKQKERPFLQLTWAGAAAPPIPLPPKYSIINQKQPITVGSSSTQNLIIPDLHVDPHHLTIRLHNDEQWQARLQTNNTTTLGERVLAPGEWTDWPAEEPIAIGAYRLHLQLPDGEATNRSELIGVEIVPDLIEIEPGFQARTSLTLRNKSRERLYFKLEIKDVKDENIRKWFVPLQEALIINPGEQREVPLRISPYANSPSGDFSFTVQARAFVPGRNKKDATYQQKGTVRIRTDSQFSTKLETAASRNRGIYHLIITNHGNHEGTFTVTPHDPLGKLYFAWREGTPDDTETPNTPTPPAAPAATASGLDRQMQQQAQLAVRQSNLGQIISRVTEPVRRGRIVATQTGIGSTGKGQKPVSQDRFSNKAYWRFKSETPPSPTIHIPKEGKRSLYLLARPRKRPFKWQAEQEIPFSISASQTGDTISPQTQTAVLHITSHLQRVSSIFLFTLIFFTCLFATAITSFFINNQLHALEVARGTAVANAPQDPDGDGLSTDDEINQYGTDPFKEDTDGDTLPDGTEIQLRNKGYNISPTNPDTDGDGLSDAQQYKIFIPTATPQVIIPYPTAPFPTPTPIPTVTPFSTPEPPPIYPTAQATVLPQAIEENFWVGDNEANQPLRQSLTFSLAGLPAEAMINDAYLTLILPNPESYPSLVNKLGNLYAIVSNDEQVQSLLTISVEPDAILAAAQRMEQMPSANNVWFTKLPQDVVAGQTKVTVLLFFELGTNLDGTADRLLIAAKPMPTNEHPPTLHIFYQTPLTAGQ